MCLVCFVVFKQKTAYEMRISDWSSDVCSSDLRTGFSAIRELLPGTCRWFDGVALSVEPTWLPGKHILCQRSGEVAGIANELQRLIINCTAAWSASRSQILVELSGGLDSSIVPDAPKSADAAFLAITFATPGSEGNASVNARAVPGRCG